MVPELESVMSTKSFRVVNEATGLDLLGLEQPPHEIAPFGEAAIWVTIVYDAKGQMLGRIETACKASGCGTHTDYLVVTASPSVVEDRQAALA